MPRITDSMRADSIVRNLAKRQREKDWIENLQDAPLRERLLASRRRVVREQTAILIITPLIGIGCAAALWLKTGQWEKSLLLGICAYLFPFIVLLVSHQVCARKYPYMVFSRWCRKNGSDLESLLAAGAIPSSLREALAAARERSVFWKSLLIGAVILALLAAPVVFRRTKTERWKEQLDRAAQSAREIGETEN